MPQLYCQVASRPAPWLLGRTSAGLCTLQVACALTVTYSGGSPVADTIAAGSAATVYGGSAATFDASRDVWVVLTVAGSGALQVTKEADVAAVTGDWAGLARIVQHAVEPYQPQAYLASGGVGGSVPSTATFVSAPGAERIFDLGNSGGGYASEPPSWQDVGFDDSGSGWVTSIAEIVPPFSPPPLLAGAQWVSFSQTSQAGSEIFLLRRAFSLPSAVVVGASVQVGADAELLGAWINGTVLYSGDLLLWPDPGSPSATTLTIPPSALVSGGPNVLALKIRNEPAAMTPGPTGAQYLLSVTSGAQEGDLLYFHSGAWTDLPIGTTGQELTVVSGDPAWATPPAGYSDPLSAKGDLLTRSASATVRLGVGSNGQVLTADSTQTDGIKWGTPAAGSVSSVDVAVPSPLASAGGPITSSGTITLSWASGQTANRVLATPDGSSGAVALRALVTGDIPALPASQITSGQLAVARGGTGLDGSAASNGQVLIGNGSGYSLATLTAGSNVTITNGAGSVTIASGAGTSSPLTTKGDLWGYSSADARVPVGSNTQVLTADSTQTLGVKWATPATGTVTSVALTVPAILSVSGSPVTTSGTLSVSLANENVATVFAGPASGSAAAPTFRALQGSDLPAAASAGGHIHAHGHLL